eukprot:1502758-Amphidinium_carterae.1
MQCKEVPSDARWDMQLTRGTWVVGVSNSTIRCKDQCTMPRRLARGDGTSSSHPVQERILWHGTSPECARNIASNGFNRAYSGRHGPHETASEKSAPTDL